MLSKRNYKLNKALALSIFLHLLLIGILVVGAMTHVTQIIAGGDNGESIDAIMVDPQTVTQQYNRQQQQQLESARAEALRQKQAAEQVKAVQEQQRAEQERIKRLEKERLEAQEVAKKAAENKRQQEEAARVAAEQKRKADMDAARAKAEAEKQQQLALDAKKRAEEAAKQRAAKELAEKQRIEKELQAAKAEADKAKAEAEKQRKLAEESKKQAEEAKRQEAELRELFGGLASSQNAPADSSASRGPTSSEIEKYTGQVKNAISNKFKDPQLYRGKTCTLNIKLAPDGLLIDVKAIDGDPALCRGAILAARTANIPKPPNRALYEMFKDAKIEFQPD